jgi:hypothetical protein
MNEVMTTRPAVTARAAAVVLGTTWLMTVGIPAALAADAPRLVDDAGGRSLFSGSARGPGSTQSACLTVTASGAVAGDLVTIAATDVSGGLAAYLNVAVEAGTGTTGGGRCTSFSGSPVWSGTLAGFGAIGGDGAATGWEPANAATRAFRITVSLVGDPAAMGQTATASFAWRLVPGVVVPPSPTPTTEGPTQEPVPPVPVPTTTTVTAPSITSSARMTAAPTSSGGSGSSATAGATSSPRPARTPKAEVTVPGLPGGPGSSSGASGGLAAKIAHWVGRKIGKVAGQTVDVVQSLARKPQYTFGPVLLAVLFLFLQHLVDLRDPKLAKAFRTQRDLMLEFPADYDRVEER